MDQHSENKALSDLPAFLEVRYIFFFFILTFTVPHKIPESKMGEEGGAGETGQYILVHVVRGIPHKAKMSLTPSTG